MAHLVISEGVLRLQLNRWERIFGLHGDIEVAADRIESIEYTDNPWPHVHGLRWPGTGLPDIITLGTLRHHGERDFSAIYGRGATTIVTLRDCEFRRLIVSGHWLEGASKRAPE